MKQSAKKQPAKQKPAKKQPAKKQPAKKQPAKKQPAKKQPAKKQPAKKQPAKKQPAKKQPAKKQPAKKQPAKKQPAKKKPAKKQPAKKQPAKKQPAKKQPAKKQPAKKQPAKKKPAKKQPAKKQPAKKKPTKKKPAKKKPAKKKPAKKKPAKKQPAKKQPAKKKPAKKQPAKKKPTKKEHALDLERKTVVVTGTFAKPRKEIEACLKAAGAKLTGSVSRKTDYLLVGSKAGSKLAKAKSLGVVLLSEQDMDQICAAAPGAGAVAPATCFAGFDLSDFWKDSAYARKSYTDVRPTPRLVSEVEAELGYKLPGSYVHLMSHTRNGGIPRKTCIASETRTTWAEDHVAITGIFAIGRAKTYSLLGSLGSPFMQAQWGYPTWGVCICDCPSAGHDMIMLDYRACGPTGEPQVVHVDQEWDFAVTVLAPTFEAFIRGLVDCDKFE